MAKWSKTGAPGAGWYLKVRPAASGEPAFRHLLRGAEMRPWLMREMERLQLALTAEGASPALADGGVPVADIAARLSQGRLGRGLRRDVPGGVVS